MKTAPDEPEVETSPPSDVATMADVRNSDTAQSSPSAVVEGLRHPLSPLEFDRRYVFERQLGRGGMGEVHLCLDEQIGRRVAMKQLTERQRENPAALERFVREARIQARLEHPAIVPVYDLGTTPEGELYFTMKRLRGVTLSAVLRKLRAEDPATRDRFTDRRLLTDFSRVCLVVDFAHQNAVIHRDIKPANIMLGDFGEVYVLDWGIAKTEEDEEPAQSQMLGTVGYMAPEQVEDAASVTAAADVFSLGCILYELLTFERAIAPDASMRMLTATLEGVEHTPADRAGQRAISPELDALCMRALGRDPESRPTARELHEAIEGFLDGQRDLELRKTMAERHAETAGDLLAKLREADDDDAALEARREALRAVGRALALDPGHPTATTTLVELLTRPPERVPTEVDRSLEHRSKELRRGAAKMGVGAYLTLLLYLPLFFWAGIRDPAPIIVYVVAAVTASAVSYFSTRKATPSDSAIFAALVASTIAMASTAALFGPLVIAPGLVAINIAAFAMTEARERRWLFALVGVAAIVIPVGLETVGVLPPSYSFADGAMIVGAWAIRLEGTPALALLTIAGLANVITAVAIMGLMRRALTKAERRAELYSWQIRQLLP